MSLEEMLNDQLLDEKKGIIEYTELIVKISEEVENNELKAALIAGISKLKADEESHFDYLTLVQKLLKL